MTVSGSGMSRVRRPLGSALSRCVTFSRIMPGHEPRRPRCVDLVQQRERHGQRETVLRMARREAILERQRRAGHRDRFGIERFRHVRGGVAHQELAREVQDVRGSARSAPSRQRSNASERVDLLRQPLVVEARDHGVVDQHVLPPRLVLERRDLGDEPAVVREERAARRERARNERLADEHLARGRADRRARTTRGDAARA